MNTSFQEAAEGRKIHGQVHLYKDKIFIFFMWKIPKVVILMLE